jgi:Fe-Mn family superoxide dismutase
MISRRQIVKTLILSPLAIAAACKTKNLLPFTKNSSLQPKISGETMSKIELPALPYARTALAPHISENTLNFHYGKHHQAYVTNLNNLIAGTDLEGKSLEEIIKISAADKSKAGIFNNAAQIWNHTFYFNSFSPNGGGAPQGALAAAIDAAFGSFDNFKKKFIQTNITLFNSN